MPPVTKPPRIDSHHHLWRYTPEDYGWIGDDLHALRRDFLSGDLKRLLQESSVDGAVAVQARQTVEETRFLLDQANAADSPILGVVGWLPLTDVALPALLEEFRGEKRLRGLRHIVQAEAAGFMDYDAFNRGIRAMRNTGLVYDLLIYARQLQETTRFVDRHPAQPFVLDHIAKPDIRNHKLNAWRDDLRNLAQRPNVACKLSGMVTEADVEAWTEDDLQPYFDVAVEAFGPQRLMIGTDWPVVTAGCSYAEWWRVVEARISGLSTTEQASILGGTATRIYGLSIGSGRSTGREAIVRPAAMQ